MHLLTAHQIQLMSPRVRQVLALTALVLVHMHGFAPAALGQAAPEPGFETWWLEKQSAEVPWEGPRVCQLGGNLPEFEVTPATAGRQLVRVSVPFAEGSFPTQLGLLVHGETATATPDVRVLTRHPGQPEMVRRALLTFPYTFPSAKSAHFRVEHLNRSRAPLPKPSRISGIPGGFQMSYGGRTISVTESGIRVSQASQTLWFAGLIAPPRVSVTPSEVNRIEYGDYSTWVRLDVPDPVWPRIIEVRADCLGTVAAQVLLQRVAEKDGFAPDLGWRLQYGQLRDPEGEKRGSSVGGALAYMLFENGEPFSTHFSDGILSFPEAPFLRKGSVEIDSWPVGTQVTYHRCRAADQVPHQPMAWRRAGFVVTGPGQPEWTSLDEPPQQVHIEAQDYDAIYGSGSSPKSDRVAWIGELLRANRDAIVSSVLQGDDFGNVTAQSAGGTAPVFGMNRLNHCPAIFEEFYRSGDSRLRKVALDWCRNFHDLSIWWGMTEDYGGTRYNNANAAGQIEHATDAHFMWRTNYASHFCTKGIDSFFYAYEETGDPRMLVALEAQKKYVHQNMHAIMPPGEPRNIGMVADLMRLAQFTGDSIFGQEDALRLSRELRDCLSKGEDLFTQSCAPIEPDPPFIDDDALGYKHPFIKPYIAGYALAGLPTLAERYPNEDRLRDVVRAVADFMAASQDPVGGWRYPHPASSRCILAQAMEHAHQLCNAIRFLESQGESVGALLDALERTLQGRVQVWLKTRKVLSGLQGWEISSGLIQQATEIYRLYKTPSERDRSRDYTEGAVSLNGAPPEGLVYLPEVLRFYLERRPTERLVNAGPELTAVLNRLEPAPDVASASETISSASREYRHHSIERNLPVFTEPRLRGMAFAGAFDPAKGESFSLWRREARERLLREYQTPTPETAFNPVVLVVEDRGTYEARKIVLGISAWDRIPAYLLVPKGLGPFAAVIALHDHGAHFSIGKEKVIRPIAEAPDRIQDATQWVSQCYGGRFIGDELARRGYVVFAMDALYWGDRGRAEGVSYEDQQAFASNLLQMGMSWAGIIAQEDLRSAEFVAGLPEVDPDRIGAIGLSMGANRAWHLAAGTDRIKAGAAICWLTTTAGVLVPGNNQTVGQSAFSMLHPGSPNWIDYPQTAAIACPKPMLFFCGEQDALFPVESVREAFDTLRKTWESQGAGPQLVTRLWPVPHVFNVEMQAEAFDFLDRSLAKR